MSSIKTLMHDKATTQGISFSFVDDNGDPYDITGSTVGIVINSDRSLADDDVYFRLETTSHTDPSGGLSSITIPKTAMSDADVSSKYWYHTYLQLAGGEYYIITKGDYDIDWRADAL